MKYSAFLIIPVLLVACGDASIETSDEKQILHVIDRLQEASNKVDPSIFEQHLLMDDPRFSEIEDFIPEPFGSETLRSILEWFGKNGKPGNNVKFTKTRVYILSSMTAYTTSIQELDFDKPSRSRVTFIFMKDREQWKVIHAHYSAMPDKEPAGTVKPVPGT
jgi:hypothetical protein